MKFSVRMAAPKKAEIWLYDYIGRDTFFGDAVSAKMIGDQLNKAGKIDVINLRVNSEGGEAMEGVAMYNILDRHPARIEVDIEGVALSAATIPVMAGDTIRIAANALMMIHDPYTFSGGTAEDLRKTADLLDTVAGSIATTYASRTGNKIADINKWMNEELWMTASESIDYGFADEITNALEIAAQFSLTRFKNAPAHAIARCKQRTPCASDQMRSKLRAMAQRASELRGGK